MWHKFSWLRWTGSLKMQFYPTSIFQDHRWFQFAEQPFLPVSSVFMLNNPCSFNLLVSFSGFRVATTSFPFSYSGLIISARISFIITLTDRSIFTLVLVGEQLKKFSYWFNNVPTLTYGHRIWVMTEINEIKQSLHKIKWMFGWFKNTNFLISNVILMNVRN